MKACWLDFYSPYSEKSKKPENFIKILKENNFNCIEEKKNPQIWQLDEYSSIIVEVLNVDSAAHDPVSLNPTITAAKIDQLRRELCVPARMDPFYRCMIYDYDYIKNPHKRELQSEDLSAVLELFNDVLSSLMLDCPPKWEP